MKGRVSSAGAMGPAAGKGRSGQGGTMFPEPSTRPVRPPTPVWLRRVTALGLGLVTFALVLIAQRDVGIARDETVYMSAGSRYASWWIAAARREGVTRAPEITQAFGGPGATDGNREHPPLMKTLFGLSERFVHHRHGWTGEVTAFRLPTAATFALLVVLVFLMTQAIWGYAEGLVAGLLVLCMPRLFFHAGVACFDAPIAALWFATIYVWWRGLASRGWMIGCGVVFGLALATKHNALILPLALGAHYVFVAGRVMENERLRWRPRVAATGVFKRRPWAVASLIVLGPLTLVAVWPWLWFDTFAHLRAWIAFHLHHVHYNFEYLGRSWNHPPFPWHVAVVTTLFTVPAATLAAAVVGAGAWLAQAWRGDSPDVERAPGVLLALSAAASMGPFFLGSTPIFGAEKHWAPAMPSLAIAAGVGVVWAGRAAAAWLGERAAKLASAGVERGLVAAVAIAVVGAAAIETRHAQPYALSSYNAIAGGAPGGADLGMNRQFWGYAARGVLPYLRSQAAPGGASMPVYSHDASPAWGLYLRDGLLPKSMPDSGGEYQGGIERSRFAIVVHERHFNRHDYLIWSAYGTVQPVFVLRMDGVPLVSVYRRP